MRTNINQGTAQMESYKSSVSIFVRFSWFDLLLVVEMKVKEVEPLGLALVKPQLWICPYTARVSSNSHNKLMRSCYRHLLCNGQFSLEYHYFHHVIILFKYSIHMSIELIESSTFAWIIARFFVEKFDNFIYEFFSFFREIFRFFGGFLIELFNSIWTFNPFGCALSLSFPCLNPFIFYHDFFSPP